MPSAVSARAPSARSPGRSTTVPLGWLRSLVELRDLGLTRPLPMPIATAAAWAEAHARELWVRTLAVIAAAPRVGDRPHSDCGFAREDADAYHRKVFGDAVPPQVLVDDGLADYAWRIWEPLVTGDRREDRQPCPTEQPDPPGPPLPFDITGALPTGTVLLEASAGTGKTGPSAPW